MPKPFLQRELLPYLEQLNRFQSVSGLHIRTGFADLNRMRRPPEEPRTVFWEGVEERLAVFNNYLQRIFDNLTDKPRSPTCAERKPGDYNFTLSYFLGCHQVRMAATHYSFQNTSIVGANVGPYCSTFTASGAEKGSLEERWNFFKYRLDRCTADLAATSHVEGQGCGNRRFARACWFLSAR